MSKHDETIESNYQLFKTAYGESNFDTASEAICRVFYAFYKINRDCGESIKIAHSNAKRTIIPILNEVCHDPNKFRDNLLEKVQFYWRKITSENR